MDINLPFYFGIIIFAGLAVYKRSIVLLLLAASFFAQFHMRDILFQLNLNLNSVFGINVQDNSYKETIFLSTLFLYSLIISIICLWSEPKKWKVSNRKCLNDYLLGFCLCASFIYFGGLNFNGEQTRAEGSSLLIAFSMIAVAQSYSSKGIKNKIIALLGIFFSTQKLLVIVFTSQFLNMRKISSYIKFTIITILFIFLAVLARGELNLDQMLLMLGATVFGHYESILPIYKYLEHKNSIINFEQILLAYVDVLGVLVPREDTIYMTFNETLFKNWGVIIVPTTLLVFFETFGKYGVVICAVISVLHLRLVYFLFSLLVNKNMATAFMCCFTLLFLESSPDALTSFYRLMVILLTLKIVNLTLKGVTSSVRKIQ